MTTKRAVAVGCLLLSSALTSCGGSDDDPDATPSHEPEPTAVAAEPPIDPNSRERGQQLLERLRKAVVAANTGEFEGTLSLQGGGISNQARYRLSPPASVQRVELAFEEQTLTVEAIAIQDRIWTRMFGVAGDPGPTCWMSSTAEVMAEFTGQQLGPGLQTGVPAPVAAIDRAVHPYLVDDTTLRVRADLAAITASMPGKLFYSLNIDPLGYAKVEVDIKVDHGRYEGWTVQVGDIVDSAMEAGYIDEDGLGVDPAFLQGTFDLDIVDLGIDLTVPRPAADQVVTMTPDDEAGFEAAMQACMDRG